jgi:plastocyanin
MSNHNAGDPEMLASILSLFSPRHRSLCLMASTIALAGCGGEPRSPAADTATTPPATATPATASPGEAPAAAPAAGPAAAPTAITGTTHEVRMLGDATGYRYDPANLTIKAGDGVRWTMVSGPPHNVSFWPDSIPAGAAASLTSAMAKQMSPLTGPLLIQQNETYTMSFAGAPKGRYRYFCTPHLAMGMVATIIVQ